MKLQWFAILFIFVLSAPVYGGVNIGWGTIKGYKIGDGDADTIRIWLNDDYTHDAGNCNGIVTIKFSDFGGSGRDEKRIAHMMSTVLAAYMGGKKIRFHSHKNNCDVTFVAMQEEDL